MCVIAPSDLSATKISIIRYIYRESCLCNIFLKHFGKSIFNNFLKIGNIVASTAILTSSINYVASRLLCVRIYTELTISFCQTRVAKLVILAVQSRVKNIIIVFHANAIFAIVKIYTSCISFS